MTLLRRVLGRAFASVRRLSRAGRARRAREALLEAVESCARGDFGAAETLCDRAYGLDPAHAETHYLRGLLACRRGEAEAGAAALEQALALAPAEPLFRAALADARLLQQREEEALVLYSAAFPEIAAEIASLDDAAMPVKRAHPDWLRVLRQLALALPDSPRAGDPERIARIEEVAPRHLLNWGLLLAARRKWRGAIRLLEAATAGDPQLGYGHAALALLYTLNRDWQRALAAARAARERGAEVFAGATDLCVLAAQFGLGCCARELDPVFDWSAFEIAAEEAGARLSRLPALERAGFERFPERALVFFVACDRTYLEEHALALACSIREHAPESAVHVHLFQERGEPAAALGALGRALAPVPLSATRETVDFDRYGGRRLYCASARFCRLYQLLAAARGRVALLDADSLLRGDPAPALAHCRDIALVEAPHEPMWHRYLGGFCAFLPGAASERFLGTLAAFLATQLAGGRAREYLDQIGLYAAAHLLERSLASAIERLPIGRFCDTLFRDGALVWSATQGKGEESPFTRYKRELLAGLGPSLGAASGPAS
jgi:tetratricopeptide (TPR) repeat protein